MAMRTEVYKSYTLADFDRLFVPPILLGQYYTLAHEDILLGFVSCQPDRESRDWFPEQIAEAAVQ